MKITLLTGQTFNIANSCGFDIKIIRSSTAKRLTLRIDEKNRRPILTIPSRCSSKRASAFIEEHKDWISNMLAQIPQTKKFFNGQNISLMGRAVQIVHFPKQRGNILEQNILKIGGDEKFFHRRVCDFIKETAHKELNQRSFIKAKQLGCQINRICLKDTKSRWGSCSNKNNINYNWRIALAPDFVIDYLVSHEVSHLAHQDHSQNFWICVQNLCPNYSEGRKWLKTHGKQLYAYA